MGFVEKSLFSPMAVCSVDPVGCHATVDYLDMPGPFLFFFSLKFAPVTAFGYLALCGTTGFS